MKAGAGWRGLSVWFTRPADLLVSTEPFWVIGAVALVCMASLWGSNWSWAGLVIVAASLPLRRCRLGYFIRRTPFDIPVALFLLASLVGVAVSPDRGLSWGAFQSVLAFILLYYSLANAAHPGVVIKWGFPFAAVCVLVAALVAFGNGFNPPSMVGGFGGWVQQRVQHLPQVPQPSEMANPFLSAAHGLTLAVEVVMLPLAGVLLFSRKASLGIGAALLAAPLLLVLLLFGSQAAWLAVAVGLSLLLVWRTRWAVLPLALFAGIGYLGYRLGWLDPGSLFSPFNPGESFRDRVELWKSAAGVIWDHPVAGCGLGCLGRYSTTPLLSPHNAYLQFYADVGLIGAVALVWSVVAGGRVAVGLVKAPRGPWYGFAVGLLAAAVAVAVHGIFEGAPAGIIAETAGGYRYIVSPVFALLAGLLVRAWFLVQEPTPAGSQVAPPGC